MNQHHRPYDLVGSDGDAPLQVDPPKSDGFATAAGVQASAAPVDRLYLLEPGDTSVISVNDINQGQIGDCFLLSPIGELALFDPAAILTMIHRNHNGTETVTLYTASNGQPPSFGTTSFKPAAVTVTNSFPSDSVNNGADQDVVGNQKEIWPQVLEKAAATLDGGYSAIMDGGSPVLAMEELTGQPATYMSPAALTLAELDRFVAAGDLIVLDTSTRSGLPFNLVSDHAYMFENATVQGGAAVMQVGNPWGFDQPAVIPLSQLSSAFVEVDIGHPG